MITCIALVAAFTGLSARLVYVQLVKHDEYAELAQTQRSHRVTLNPERGGIYDAEGLLMVENFPTQEVRADREHLRHIHFCVRAMAHAEGVKPKVYRSLYDDEEIRRRYAARLAHVVAGAIGEEAGEKILEMAKVDSRRQEVTLASRLDNDVADQLARILKEEKLAGIYFEESTKRHYPNSRSFSHGLGFVNRSGDGMAGIEGVLDARLRGTAGSKLVERDGNGAEIRVFHEKTVDPVDGEDVHLTIHMPLQRIVEQALGRLVQKHHPEKATVILMDPISGAILAMANCPDFNLETRVGNLRNFAVADRYEPGSTFKVISLAACYDSGAVVSGDEIFCHNGLYMEGRGFRLTDHHTYGYLSTGMVLAKSSNIGTYMMVKEMGKHPLYKYIREFGFGSKSGIALTGEVAGLVHNPNSRHWSKTSLSRVGIGYEVDVTPLQMLNALCAVANGGNLMQPQIVSKITDVYGEASYKFKPHRVRRVISEETADQVRRDMLLVTGENGTGQEGAVEGYPTGGKTGTARKPHKDRSKGYGPGYVVSFMGFLPAENPRLAGIVVVDDPVNELTGKKDQVYGGSVAAPVFREIAAAAMKYLGVEPSVVPRRALRVKGAMAAVRYRQSGSD